MCKQIDFNKASYRQQPLKHFYFQWKFQDETWWGKKINSSFLKIKIIQAKISINLDALFFLSLLEKKQSCESFWKTLKKIVLNYFCSTHTSLFLLKIIHIILLSEKSPKELYSILSAWMSEYWKKKKYEVEQKQQWIIW